MLALAGRRDPPVRWVVVTAEPITDIDATAAETIGQLLDELEQQGVVLACAELKATSASRSGAGASWIGWASTGSTRRSGRRYAHTGRPKVSTGWTGRTSFLPRREGVCGR